MDFQAIYSDGAQSYFSTLWKRLLDSVEEDVGSAQALKVVDFLYASGSLTDCPRPLGAVKRPQRSLVFYIEDYVCMALLYGRAGRLTAFLGGFRPMQFKRSASVTSPATTTSGWRTSWSSSARYGRGRVCHVALVGFGRIVTLVGFLLPSFLPPAPFFTHHEVRVVALHETRCRLYGAIVWRHTAAQCCNESTSIGACSITAVAVYVFERVSIGVGT